MRLYLLCEGMQWSHLPVGGGLYAQHPKLLDEWSVIFEEKAKWDREHEQPANKSPSQSGVPRIT